MNETLIRPWGDQEKAAWLARQSVKRSYADDVLRRIDDLGESFEISQYGALSCDPTRYPLFKVCTKAWNNSHPTVLITGGVHGYETSGVHGALAFMKDAAMDYADRFNIVCAPCVSPWAYETINRWNPLTIDPNRAFYPDSPAEESAALMKMVGDTGQPLLMHIDLHETTDTDNTVFRPDRAARDGIQQDVWNIPDGFYTVGDTENPRDEFQGAIIDAVRAVTHIAPPVDGCLIGKPITQEGVVNYDVKQLFLCTGFSDAQYCTTTEVYPDSPRTNPEECIRAQVAAVRGGLEYLMNKHL